MTEAEVRTKAFAMPITSPDYPPGPYRFTNREFFIVSYESDPDAVRAVLPEPLEFVEPVVKYEFIRMPDSAGFGDYTESGQVIPVEFRRERGAYVHAMYLDCEAPLAAGRELWGFPKKLASPRLAVEKDTLLGELKLGSVLVAVATMGYKHRALPLDKTRELLSQPNFLLKIIPHVDGSARICELVRYFMRDITVKGAWEGPAGLELFQHALAPVCALPVRKVLGAVHILADLTLELGTVVYDYLANGAPAPAEPNRLSQWDWKNSGLVQP